MKKGVTMILAAAMLLLGTTFLFAQIDYSLNDWGRIRLYDATDARQIDRISLNFGVDKNIVHHYKDVGGIEPVLSPTEITPTVADVENVQIFSYDIGDVAIAVNVKQHIYFWNDKNYLIANIRLINNTGEDVNSYASIEVIPQVNNAYGDETLDYDQTSEIAIAYKTDHYTGVKMLSHTPASFRSLYYSDYSMNSAFPDSVQWNEMVNSENSDYPFEPGSDGSANFLNAGETIIAADDSVDIYVAIGYATTLVGLQALMADAGGVYDQFLKTTAVAHQDVISYEFRLVQNYPNPFNPSTVIPFSLSEPADVTLKIYNIKGQLIRSLTSGKMNAGNYELKWDARDDFGQKVVSGLYLYQLNVTSENMSKNIVRKMILSK